MTTFLRTTLTTLVMVWLCGCATLQAQGAAGGVEGGGSARTEIEAGFRAWNAATGRGDLVAVMEQFDAGEGIMLIGSDRGEVFKGRQQIEAWLGKLFEKNRFTWDIKRMDIDPYQADSAWIFIDGSMKVSDIHGKLKGETPYRITGALTRRGHLWKWRIWSGAIPAGE